MGLTPFWIQGKHIRSTILTLLKSLTLHPAVLPCNQSCMQTQVAVKLEKHNFFFMEKHRTCRGFTQELFSNGDWKPSTFSIFCSNVKYASHKDPVDIIKSLNIVILEGKNKLHGGYSTAHNQIGCNKRSTWICLGLGK